MAIVGIASSSSSSSTAETIHLCRSVLFFSLSWVWSKMRSVRKIRYYTGFSGQGIFVFVSLAGKQKPGGVLKNPFLVSFSNVVILFEPKCVVFLASFVIILDFNYKQNLCLCSVLTLWSIYFYFEVFPVSLWLLRRTAIFLLFLWSHSPMTGWGKKINV